MLDPTGWLFVAVVTPFDAPTHPPTTPRFPVHHHEPGQHLRHRRDQRTSPAAAANQTHGDAGRAATGHRPQARRGCPTLVDSITDRTLRSGVFHARHRKRAHRSVVDRADREVVRDAPQFAERCNSTCRRPTTRRVGVHPNPTSGKGPLEHQVGGVRSSRSLRWPVFGQGHGQCLLGVDEVVPVVVHLMERQRNISASPDQAGRHLGGLV